MRTSIYLFLLFFILVCSVIQAQNYYVASLQGEVYYNDVPLQKRDRIQVSGTIRFGSQDDWVKLSGPGGMYILSANMSDEGSSEFLLTVRQELFPPVRLITTIGQNSLGSLNSGGNEEEQVALIRAKFIAEFTDHIQRCQPRDLWELLIEYRFASYADETFSISARESMSILEEAFSLPRRSTSSKDKKNLWLEDYDYYYTGHNSVIAAKEQKWRFLSGTVLRLPSSIRKKEYKYLWLHEAEAGLSYRLAEMHGNSHIVVRDDEFPEGVVNSAILLVTDLTIVDTLLITGATIDDAYRYLCSCYGVGSYKEHDQMVLKDFENPSVIPRDAFEDDMRFHINASRAKGVYQFLDDYLYGGYIYETYGSVYNIVKTLRKLGLKMDEE